MRITEAWSHASCPDHSVFLIKDTTGFDHQSVTAFSSHTDAGGWRLIRTAGNRLAEYAAHNLDDLNALYLLLVITKEMTDFWERVGTNLICDFQNYGSKYIKVLYEAK